MVEYPATFKVLRLFFSVKLNGNQVNSWAAPATVSKRGCIHLCHCETYSSWEGDTSNLTSPDIGLERVWKYRVGQYPDRPFALKKLSRRYFLTYKSVDGGST